VTLIIASDLRAELIDDLACVERALKTTADTSVLAALRLKRQWLLAELALLLRAS
jgi:hypothetical protein